MCRIRLRFILGESELENLEKLWKQDGKNMLMQPLWSSIHKLCRQKRWSLEPSKSLSTQSVFCPQRTAERRGGIYIELYGESYCAGLPYRKDNILHSWAIDYPLELHLEFLIKVHFWFFHPQDPGSNFNRFSFHFNRHKISWTGSPKFPAERFKGNP